MGMLRKIKETGKNLIEAGVQSYLELNPDKQEGFENYCDDQMAKTETEKETESRHLYNNFKNTF